MTLSLKPRSCPITHILRSMRRATCQAISLCVLWLACGGWAAAQGPLQFRDVTDETGLRPLVAGIAGHAVAWGDVDGDGRPDLYIGTFGGHPYGSKKNLLLRQVDGKFQLDGQAHLQVLGRAGGAVMADLNNNGRLDLYLSNHALDARQYGHAHYGELNFLWRNEGGGRFSDVTAASGTRPADFRGRSIAVLDFDGDGLLDLAVGECFLQGGLGRSKLLGNRGNLTFEDVTLKAGLPESENTGLGVAAGDLNGDGWPDLVFVGRTAVGKPGGNRVFINDGRGRFRELPPSHGDFTWEYRDTGDDTPCGVCLADVNRDGRLDVVIGQHFDRPWYTGGVPVRLYLNLGNADGLPRFRDATTESGLAGLPMKAPHVEVHDFDNDGWPDLYIGVLKFAAGKVYPLVLRSAGVPGAGSAGETRGGVARLRDEVSGVNDFPTAEDRQLGDVLKFFDKMNAERKITYMPAAPTCDYDRDGRIDMFLANWWVDQPSFLLRNETNSGHWLVAAVDGRGPVNRMGIGSVLRVYEPGKLGQPEGFLGMREIGTGYGYASGQEAVAHFGLGRYERCDMEIILPHGKGRIVRRDVAANQRLTIRSDEK
jgi:enediyne biosynthesis protein E4